MSEFSGLTMEFVMEEKQRNDLNTQGLLAMHLATMTLMIDAKLITAEEAVERIRQSQSWTHTPVAEPQRSPLMLAAIEFFRDASAQGSPRWRPSVVAGLDLDGPKPD